MPWTDGVVPIAVEGVGFEADGGDFLSRPEDKIPGGTAGAIRHERVTGAAGR